ncbi:MAG: InlB B-repeat-containing protein [Defluviitaleaceae bacterium]|nr:InlB B-repeat-containing protein [Defluviitaleaceae bacterium]
MIKKCVCFIIIFSMTFLSFPNFVEAQSIDNGPRIESVRGTVFVQRVGGHSLAAVHRGMNIYDGDVIITGINSAATIIYYEQMIIMGELTTLSVNSIWQRHGRNNSTISLVEGMIKVRVDMRLDDGSRNMVQAAGTIVGVRGTKYILTYRRMIFDDDGIGIGNPFVRMLVIDGEVVVDLPDPDNLGDVATFLVTPQGMQRLTEDIQGRQVHGESENVPEMLAIPLESLDLIILEAIRDDLRILEQNPDLFNRIEEAIELRIIEDERRMQALPERPPPQIITGSEADEVLPTLPAPGTPTPGTGTGTGVGNDNVPGADTTPGTGAGTAPGTSEPPNVGTPSNPVAPPDSGLGTTPGTGNETTPDLGNETTPGTSPDTGTPPGSGNNIVTPPGTPPDSGINIGTPPGTPPSSGANSGAGNGNDSGSGSDLIQPPAPITRTVTFNFNFTGAPANETRTVNNGNPVLSPPTAPNRTGFSFAGWFDTSAASGGNEFATGASGTAVTTDRTVYARWTPDAPITRTVTFNFNFAGAPANETRTVNNGNPVLSPPTAPSRTGFSFAGWFDTSAASGGNEFATGASGTAVTADRTVYARWTSAGVEVSNPLHPAERALIPITTTGLNRDERFNSGLDFVVRVNGLADAAEADGVDLDITPVPGLTFNWDPNDATFANGTKTFLVDVNYNGTTEFSSATANIVVGLTGVSSGHSLFGETDTYTVTIRDGQSAGTRAIPLTQANIIAFNAALNNDATATGLRSRHFVLHENITLTQSWVTIPSFNGEINGAQHTISDMTIQVIGDNDRGMFGTIQANGRIAYLGLVNLNIPHTITGGGFAAVNSGTITNSFVSGGIISGGGGSNVGGLVGTNSGTIINSFANINIIGAGTNIGGIVGVNSGNVTNCVVLSQSLVAGSSNTGRIVGNNSGNINNNFGRSDISMGRQPNDIIRDGTDIMSGNVTAVQTMLDTNHNDPGRGIFNAPNLTGILGSSLTLPIAESIALDIDIKEEEFPNSWDEEDDQPDSTSI